MLIALGTGMSGLDAVFRRIKSATTYDAFALAHLSRIPEAATALEKGRARFLAESMAVQWADSTRISNLELQMRYTKARDNLIAAQAMLNTPFLFNFDPDSPLINQELNVALTDQELRSAAYRQARELFNTIIEDIKATYDLEEFMNTTIDSEIILAATENYGYNHAIVYLTATPWGGLAIAALATDPTSRKSSRFASLYLPELTYKLESDLVIRPLDEKIGSHFIGGFGLALKGDRNDLLLRDWHGSTFRDRSASLNRMCVASQKKSTLNDVIQEVLNIEEFTYLGSQLMKLFDQPMDEIKSDELALLQKTLHHTLLRRELKLCLNKLADIALSPLVIWLRKEGAKSFTLIPCGWLAIFPLLAADITPGQTSGDILTASIAPSARSLLSDAQDVLKRSGVYALGDPRPTTSALEWGEAEAHTLAKIARNMHLPVEVKVHEQATKDWLIEVLSKGQLVAISCHGTFNLYEPLQSALVLAQEQVLTLDEMLRYQANLRGIKLLILSACETAFIDLNNLDEVRSLATAMLQAGVRAVLASLWSVDDKATYLLMVRFAQEWLPNMENEPAAAALARAQHWLRTVTHRELQSWHAIDFPTPTIEEKRLAGSLVPSHNPWEVETKRLRDAIDLVTRGERDDRYNDITAEHYVQVIALRQGNPDTRPYEDPIYWAGFQIIGW